MGRVTHGPLIVFGSSPSPPPPPCKPADPFFPLLYFDFSPCSRQMLAHAGCRGGGGGVNSTPRCVNISFITVIMSNVRDLKRNKHGAALEERPMKRSDHSASLFKYTRTPFPLCNINAYCLYRYCEARYGGGGAACRHWHEWDI